jgi:predicted nucleic acid-binding protein
VNTRPGLLDTSVFIASESGRRLDVGSLPERTAMSVLTIGELHVGVLAAADIATRARRLATLEGRRAKINDLWIAAVAKANDMDVVTQNDDFDVIEQAGGPTVIRV